MFINDGKDLSMATFYNSNKGDFTGKCSATIYKHDYTAVVERQDEFDQNP
jgi:hypothetical protein